MGLSKDVKHLKVRDVLEDLDGKVRLFNVNNSNKPDCLSETCYYRPLYGTHDNQRYPIHKDKPMC